MCQLASVSRRSFYRSLQERQPTEEEMEVRSAIQVNHKRVARIMREDNLLGVQPERFVVTTNSNHKLEIYLNLASRMKLTGVNQLWVADITYIRLKAEFVYLAVILDRFSRKVVGWALDRTLGNRLAVGALEQAIEKRQPPPGLVHHSDRGLQYASAEYAAILEKHRMVPSMSRPANPYDKDYASHCTSWVRCDTTSLARRRWDSFTPWAFRGGLSPGCSYRQSFLPLQA